MSDSDSMSSMSDLELTSESDNDFESDDDVPKQTTKRRAEPTVVQHTKNSTPAKRAKIDKVTPSKVTSTAAVGRGVTTHTKVYPTSVGGKPTQTQTPDSAPASAPVSASASAAMKPSALSSSSSSSAVRPAPGTGTGTGAGTNIIAPPGLDTGDCTKGPLVTTELNAKRLIIKYLKQQNRPYSSIQVFDNLHKRIQKPTIDKLLNALSDNAAPDSNNEIVCKEYGKAKIYFYSQHMLDKSLEGGCSLEEIEQELKELSRTVEDVNTTHTQLKRSVDDLKKQPTDQELDDRLAEVEAAVQGKRAKVASISGVSIDENALEKSVLLHNKYRSSWAQRKSKCMEIVDMIADGMGKSIKHVSLEVGLETDEESNEMLPKGLQVPVKSTSGGSGSGLEGRRY